MAGRTDGFKLVNFEANEDLTGKFVKVRITKGKTFSLEGELAKSTASHESRDSSQEEQDGRE